MPWCGGVLCRSCKFEPKKCAILNQKNGNGPGQCAAVNLFLNVFFWCILKDTNTGSVVTMHHGAVSIKTLQHILFTLSQTQPPPPLPRAPPRAAAPAPPPRAPAPAPRDPPRVPAPLLDVRGGGGKQMPLESIRKSCLVKSRVVSPPGSWMRS